MLGIEPNVRLDPTIPISWPEQRRRVGGLTDWATQVPETCLVFRVPTPGAEALLYQWWLKQERSSTVKEILKVGNLLDPRVKQPNHILEDADKGKIVLQSWQVLISLWFLCMSLFRATVHDFSLHADRRTKWRASTLSFSEDWQPDHHDLL